MPGLAAAGLVAAPGVANAGTYTVDTPFDAAGAVCPVGACSLRRAVTAANASPGDDTIYLPNDLGVYNLGSQLEVTDDRLTIKGKGLVGVPFDQQDPPHIDGQGATRLFKVLADAELDLRWIHLQGGDVSNGTPYDNQGGAIDNAGWVRLNRVRLTENAATNGGAVYSRPGSTLVVEESVFSDNTAILYGASIYASEAILTAVKSTIKGGLGGAGGGIAAYASSVDIQDSSIYANLAVDGGGLYLFSSTLNLGDAEFYDNAAEQRGGAIFSQLTTTNTTTILNIEGTHLHDNEAADGAAVSAVGGFLTMTDVEVSENSTSSSQIVDMRAGGAVTYAGSRSLFTDCTFDFNTGPMGAALTVFYPGSPAPNNKIDGGLFWANTADDKGGAVWYRSTRPTALPAATGLEITNTVLVGNQADSGGALWSSQDLKRCELNPNCGDGAFCDQDGGVSYCRQLACDSFDTCYAYPLVIDSASFYANGAALDAVVPDAGVGGAILNHGQLHAINTTFSTNSATVGGAIYQIDADHPASTIPLTLLSHSTLAENSATSDANAVAWKFGHAVVGSSIVDDNDSNNLAQCLANAPTPFSSVTSGDHNVVSSDIAACLGAALGDDQILVSADLDALVIGTSPHYPLLSSSVALANGTCQTVDGAPLPEDQLMHARVACDSGSIESSL
ncbi:MAG: hypothetical protein R3B09_03180 [Nannocystaceae bacterium]